MAKQPLPRRNSPRSRTSRIGQARSPVKGVRRRSGGNYGNGKPFKPGTNSHNGEVHRRGPDLIARGTVSSLYRAVLDDNGTLEASLVGDTRLRARLLKGIIRCIDDAKNPRSALFAAE